MVLAQEHVEVPEAEKELIQGKVKQGEIAKDLINELSK